MRRSSNALSDLIDYASQPGQVSCWLSVLRILLAVERDLLRTDGPPHPVLRYIETPRIEGGRGAGRWYIRFDELLQEQHFTGAQRQAILVAWALFNGGPKESERGARFDDICCRLDPVNCQAVVDAMDICRNRQPSRAGIDPAFPEAVDQVRRRDEAVGRVLETLGTHLEEWRDAGL